MKVTILDQNSQYSFHQVWQSYYDCRDMIRTANNFVASTALLKPQDLNDVLNRVYPARSRYYNIGLNLGIDVDTLKAIKYDERDQSHRGLDKVIYNWLISDSLHPSWKGLADALRTPSVGVEVKLTSP